MSTTAKPADMTAEAILGQHLPTQHRLCGTRQCGGVQHGELCRYGRG